jgi:hypothetical protein
MGLDLVNVEAATYFADCHHHELLLSCSKIQGQSKHNFYYISIC